MKEKDRFSQIVYEGLKSILHRGGKIQGYVYKPTEGHSEDPVIKKKYRDGIVWYYIPALEKYDDNLQKSSQQIKTVLKDLGYTYLSIFPPSDHSRELEYVRRKLRGKEKGQIRYSKVRKDGTYLTYKSFLENKIAFTINSNIFIKVTINYMSQIVKFEIENGYTESIFTLDTLEELSIQNSNLKRVPERIKEIKNLQRLILVNNELEKLPSSLANLTKLRELNVQGNKLTSLPKTFVKRVNSHRYEGGGLIGSDLPSSLQTTNDIPFQLNLYENPIFQVPFEQKKLRNPYDQLLPVIVRINYLDSQLKKIRGLNKVRNQCVIAWQFMGIVRNPKNKDKNKLIKVRDQYYSVANAFLPTFTQTGKFSGMESLVYSVRQLRKETGLTNMDLVKYIQEFIPHDSSAFERKDSYGKRYHQIEEIKCTRLQVFCGRDYDWVIQRYEDPLAFLSSRLEIIKYSDLLFSKDDIVFTVPGNVTRNEIEALVNLIHKFTEKAYQDLSPSKKAKIQTITQDGYKITQKRVKEIGLELTKRLKSDDIDILEELNVYELLAALSVGTKLKQEGISSTSFEDSYKHYQKICEEWKTRPRKEIIYNEHLSKLEKLGILRIETKKVDEQKSIDQHTVIFLCYKPRDTLIKKIEGILYSITHR